MNDENPYAPSLVAEPEAPPSRVWRLDGISLLVKNQAVLPMVDLNTGEQGGNLKCVRRALLKKNPLTFMGTLLLITAYFFLSRQYRIDPVLLVCGLFLAMFLLKQVEALRGSPSQRLHVMEYLGEKSLKRITRGKLRRWINLLYIAVVICSIMNVFPILPVLPLGIAVMAGCTVWAILDRPPARSLPGPPGWMRISPLHPEAIRFLSALQAEADVDPATDGNARRKIRTTWFYKFPLAMLLGSRRNPLAVFNLILAKLLRSHLLTRDTYHFSEAAPTALAEISAPLQERIRYWISAHPDWSYQAGTRLISPDGDIVSETAHLAPATLEHDLCITCSWNLAAPGRMIFQNSFLTWLPDDAHISTHDHPFIFLDDSKSRSFRARGGMEQVYQAHLRHCAGEALDPPTDSATRAARILALQEESDQHLTALGYQSELR